MNRAGVFASRKLDLQRILFEAQKSIALEYRGRPLKQQFQPDFVCYEKIVIEIKDSPPKILARR
ncbi:MAG TPA: GxxExxY protein [Haliangiales bacterium]|nr:GxxExxY protein [Haliangiales bacterium]